MRKPGFLLFNPWIYDFAAYDFWIKPLGLLHLAGLLNRLGCKTWLVDCLDRMHPAHVESVRDDKGPSRSDGTGKFYKEEIEKPEVLKDIPRRYGRYGIPLDKVEKMLDAVPFEPDFILITSIMSYWYPAVRDSIRLLRTKFPKANILLGGIYATLCSDHARVQTGADAVVAGPGEKAILNILEREGAQIKKGELAGSDGAADYSLYQRLESAVLVTSRGCPFRCSFCASERLTEKYSRRNPDEVFEQIRDLVERFGVRHITFYDDALLHQREGYIKPLMQRIIAANLDVRFHTPNGLQIRYIDEELAELFFRAGVKTVRLSFETSNKERQKEMSKVSNENLISALSRLEAGGYRRKDIAVYVLMGLPDQEPREFMDSVRFVIDNGAQVSVASYSPIPGTRDWQKAIAAGHWHEGNDLLLTNNSVFPIWRQLYGYEKCTQWLTWAKKQNETLN